MPKIYDNIANHLTKGLNETLEVSQRTDLCVGYFNLRGWKEISEKIEVKNIKRFGTSNVMSSDEGKEFNPFNVSVEEELDKSVEEREIGGLGIHFVKKLMDSFEYNRVNKINNITLIKNIN